ncbi:MAG: energy transducer TonB [Bacteroidota bacterium]
MKKLTITLAAICLIFQVTNIWSQENESTKNSLNQPIEENSEFEIITLNEESTDTIPDYGTPFQIVDDMPTFPGGEEQLFKFISENIQYPDSAKENNIMGTVYLSFVVTKNGSLADVKAIRSIGGGCDEEAIRVIKSMPRWNPGKQNGQAVPVQFVIPIKFALQ